MSIEIDWKALTTGPDGDALAESIRDFIHDKFQNVTLPKFIRSVKVHSFGFGDEPPSVVLKDICDPLDEFYEEDESSDEDEDATAIGSDSGSMLPPSAASTIPVPAVPAATTQPQGALNARRGLDAQSLRTADLDAARRESLGFAGGTHRPGLRTGPSFVDQLASPLLSRSSTSGVPGGTSSLNYFNTPLSAGLSGGTTPFANVAGGNHVFPAPWSDYNFPSRGLLPSHRPEPMPPIDAAQSTGDPSTRPSTANTHPLSHAQNISDRDHDALTEIASPRAEPSPNDIQLVMHVKYSGNIRIAMSAEILLDYPMSSFVSIPLQLTITGVSFDGVAIVAHVRPSEDRPAREGEEKGRAHICFLSQEDASALLGASATGLGGEDGDEPESPTATRDGGLEPLHEQSSDQIKSRKHEETHEMGGLLREIRVESEIGKRQDGRQSLKNVGKVEKFVLEQVRRIFEDEFVWPSFWTFLL